MMGTLLKLAAGGAATAVGVAVGKDVIHDVKERYRRAKIRKELRRARGEHLMRSDELEALKRKLEEADD